jgi:hypothetical protein
MMGPLAVMPIVEGLVVTASVVEAGKQNDHPLLTVFKQTDAVLSHTLNLKGACHHTNDDKLRNVDSCS